MIYICKYIVFDVELNVCTCIGVHSIWRIEWDSIIIPLWLYDYIISVITID